MQGVQGVQEMEGVLGGNHGLGAGAQPMARSSDLGRLICRRRQAMGLSLPQAAALCNVGTRFLFELEHGKATVEFDRAMRVAQRFGIRLWMTSEAVGDASVDEVENQTMGSR